MPKYKEIETFTTHGDEQGEGRQITARNKSLNVWNFGIFFWTTYGRIEYIGTCDAVFVYDGNGIYQWQGDTKEYTRHYIKYG